MHGVAQLNSWRGETEGWLRAASRVLRALQLPATFHRSIFEDVLVSVNTAAHTRGSLRLGIEAVWYEMCCRK